VVRHGLFHDAPGRHIEHIMYAGSRDLAVRPHP
jgi:hypothetical protein